MKLFKRRVMVKVGMEEYAMLQRAANRTMVTVEMASDCMRECIKYVQTEVKNGNLTRGQALKITNGMDYHILSLNECYDLAKKAWWNS